MRHFKTLLFLAFTLVILSCNNDDDNTSTSIPIDTTVNFQHKATINVGGEGAAEITAFDAQTNKLFTVNVEQNEISIHNISDLNNITAEASINLNTYGAPNSVAINNGRLAVALEADPKQNPGRVVVFNTSDNSVIEQYTVGALPDMVTFSKNGNLLLVANEGEPNDDYDNDPVGSVSIIDLSTDVITTLDFTAFNAQQATLEAGGFRVFGPNATLAMDVEPEYIAVSDDNNTAWVVLQENNGMARINLITKTIEAIYPFGFKDYSLPGNEIDPSNEDGLTQLRSVPAFGMYQPDGIAYANINGTEYIFSANEGDARDYDGFSEEERVKDLDLDETVFPDASTLQEDENVGRLQITTTLGDTDNDGEYEALYSYGARSFSVWSANGNLLYDSGNIISQTILDNTPDAFVDNRSDDKAAEPEFVEVLNIGNERYVLFLGLERSDQVMVFDVTNPTSPTFLQILSHNGDEAPEGLLLISRDESPSEKDLLVVSNEDSGTVTIYENE